ncbi:hypothetical protein Syun_022695 [Stephania yunnanensis]|uniref:Uncharacterized protein n=1 Tax=Stephania yunnanensis TaxID=152371 RepID=A0AAP0F869_9MAGN
MRTFRFRRENGHRNTRKRGECRSGVTNWCHHNNTPTHGQTTNQQLSTHLSNCQQHLSHLPPPRAFFTQTIPTYTSPPTPHIHTLHTHTVLRN